MYIHTLIADFEKYLKKKAVTHRYQSGIWWVTAGA